MHGKAVGGKGSVNQSINELLTKLFVEQPLTSSGSAIKWSVFSNHFYTLYGREREQVLIREFNIYHNGINTEP